MEKGHEMKGHQVTGIFCPGVVRNMEKDRKLKNFHIQNVCEESESLHLHASMIKTISKLVLVFKVSKTVVNVIL